MIICLYALIVLFNACIYACIFLNAYVLPYIFPNHALNWECSKVEQSFIWKMFLKLKRGRFISMRNYIMLVVYFYFLMLCDSHYILYRDFLLMTKKGKSNGRLLT